MARLESNLKMGFYPTPDKTLQLLRGWLVFKDHAKILDPCCGPGAALARLTKYSNAATYGVELDRERADQAAGKLNYLALGSIFDVRINPLASIGLLYLNPPYDTENGERVEMQFLKHATKWLCDSGTLVFLVPEHIFDVDKYRLWISHHYSDIRIVRVHRDDYPLFKQAVMFARKRDESRYTKPSVFPEKPYRHIEDASPVPYIASYTPGPEIFQGTDAVTDEDVSNNRENVLREIQRMAGTHTGAVILRPLLPLRKGHLVSLITAGTIDGRVESIDGPLVIKGFHDRKEERRIEDDVEITKETFSVGIRVMETGKGVWYDIK